MVGRLRFKQQLTLQDRLSIWAEKVRRDADRLPLGPERDAQIKKAEQADTAMDWVNSPASYHRSSDA
jgi:hypothetical protein